jgi:hypothetical protein
MLVPERGDPTIKIGLFVLRRIRRRLSLGLLLLLPERVNSRYAYGASRNCLRPTMVNS